MIEESEVLFIMTKMGFKYDKENNCYYKKVVPSGDPRGQIITLYGRYNKDTKNMQWWCKPEYGFMGALGEVKAWRAINSGQLDAKKWDISEPVSVTTEQGGKEIIELTPTPDDLGLFKYDKEGEGKKEIKEEEVKKKEKEVEKMELNWEENKEEIKRILKTLGFRETASRETLFVKDKNGNALFADFSKTPRGHFYTRKGVDAHETEEYKAFRALQEGKAKVEGNKVVAEQNGQQLVIMMLQKEEIPQEMVIEVEGKKLKLNPELLTNIKGKLFATIDAVVDAMHKAGILKGWKVEIIKYPEKILPEKKEDAELLKNLLLRIEEATRNNPDMAKKLINDCQKLIKKMMEEEEDPEDINSDKYLAVAKATVELVDGRTFEDIGDAHPLSVSGYVRPHILRLAETRAIARALRFAGNIHGAMAEEMKEYAKEY